MTRLPPNPALKQLEVLVGEWDVEVPEIPGARGKATISWIEDGAFLRFHTEAPDPAPDATLIIGRDDASGEYTLFHYDSRGVSRVYGMDFDKGEWRMWREAQGFHQRFYGVVAPDGATIRGAWEKSPDGAEWHLDLTLVYTKRP
ncbi:hypothetical protein [Actinomadura terrae]|uniref:hypothetical protein n=1 Tax=Actinomadura terrae TaxID=604353 RepID=UPI001FA7C86C|nr:hypothetical protein [Actinomadura terrae]